MFKVIVGIADDIKRNTFRRTCLVSKDITLKDFLNLNRASKCGSIEINGEKVFCKTNCEVFNKTFAELESEGFIDNKLKANYIIQYVKAGHFGNA